MFQKFLISVCLLLITGCATLSIENGLARVKPGMDKDSVLKLAGNPRRSYRAESKDHWVYNFYHRDQIYTQNITFDTGRVASITPAHLLRAPSGDDPDQAASLQDFEQQMREQSRERRGEFRDVDDPSDSPSSSESTPERRTDSYDDSFSSRSNDDSSSDSSSRDEDSSHSSSRDSDSSTHSADEL